MSKQNGKPKEKKEKNKNLALDNVKSLMGFLKQPTTIIAEALTGILSSERSDWKLSAGRVVQAVIKGNLLTQLGRELDNYRKKGEIKEDFLATDKNRLSLYELLKFIDGKIPDEVRFKAMKSIFLSSVAESATGKDEELAYELLRICSKLSSGDIVVLKAVYDISKNRLEPGVLGVGANHSSAAEWLKDIAKQIGHDYEQLIELHEETLIRLKLITGRTSQDRSGISDPNKSFRLTSLGLALCDFITRYK